MRLLRLAADVEIDVPRYSGDLTIPPSFIYNSFVLQNFGFYKLSPGGKATASVYMKKVRDYLVKCFDDLMLRQVKKYLTRDDRIKPGSKPIMEEIANTKDASRYREVFMEHTWRSESHRDENGNRIPNERWGAIAGKVQELKEDIDPSKILKDLCYPAGLFNLVHNTKTSVLDKFSNNRELLRALNKCANEKDYTKYIEYASPEIAALAQGAEESTALKPLNDEDYLNGGKSNHKHNPNYYGD